MTDSAQALRNELIRRAHDWISTKNLTRHSYTSKGGVVLFEPYTEGSVPRHGNFEPSSYLNLLANPQWARRLTKPHSQRRYLPIEKQATAFETDSCTSSDALLMNVIAHPTTAEAVAREFNWEGEATFGYKARLPLQSGRSDKTELDLVMIAEGRVQLIAEAKLTEPDFTAQVEAVVRSYHHFLDVFDPDLMERNSAGWIMDYQLIRNVLAAYHFESPFILIHDHRRPDLARRLERIRSSMIRDDLRSRCTSITWLRLAQSTPGGLSDFLSQKYGIQ